MKCDNEMERSEREQHLVIKCEDFRILPIMSTLHFWIRRTTNANIFGEKEEQEEKGEKGEKGEKRKKRK